MDVSPAACPRKEGQMNRKQRKYLEDVVRRPEPLLPGEDMLEKFLSKEARSPPMFFEGRRDERQAILEKTARTLAEFHDPTLADAETVAEGIVLVEGPPGAGKTSLATEFGRMNWKQGVFERMFRLGKSAPPVAMPVHILAEELDDEALVTRKIALTAVERHINELEKGMPREREVNYELGCRILEAVSPYGRVEAKPREVVVRKLNWDRMELEKLEDLLIVPKEKWKIPIVLVIDEIQNIRDCVRDDAPGKLLSQGEQPAKWDRTRRLQVSNLLQKIQVGRHGLPMLAICSGLNDSWPTLKATGISQPARRFSLDCLDEEDVDRIASRFFAQCRIDVSEEVARMWIHEIAERTNCYPMHVHNALRELADMLKDRSLKLSDVDIEEWKDREATKRREAYNDRLTTDMEEAAPVVAAAMHITRGGRNENTRKREFMRAIHTGIQEFRVEDNPECLWVKEMNPKWLFELLRHQGAIQTPDEQTCKSGIPSFRIWLSRLDKPLHQAASTRNLEQAKAALDDGFHPQERDRDGTTALEVAEAEKCQAIVRLMHDATEMQAAATKKCVDKKKCAKEREDSLEQDNS